MTLLAQVITSFTIYQILNELSDNYRVIGLFWYLGSCLFIKNSFNSLLLNKFRFNFPAPIKFKTPPL